MRREIKNISRYILSLFFYLCSFSLIRMRCALVMGGGSIFGLLTIKICSNRKGRKFYRNIIYVFKTKSFLMLYDFTYFQDRSCHRSCCCRDFRCILCIGFCRESRYRTCCHPSNFRPSETTSSNCRHVTPGIRPASCRTGICTCRIPSLRTLRRCRGRRKR